MAPIPATPTLVSVKAIRERIDVPQLILRTAPRRLQVLGEHYAATRKQIQENLLLSPDGRQTQLQAADAALAEQLEAIAGTAKEAAEQIQAALAQARADVASAALPMSDDQGAVDAAWKRAWMALTRENISYFSSEAEIVQQLAVAAEPAMLSAMWQGIPLWTAAQRGGGKQAREAARVRSDELLALADRVARATTYGDVLGHVQHVEETLPGQMRAVDLALDEVEGAVALARFQAQTA